MAQLTGPAGTPGLGPPPGFLERLDATCADIARSGRALGTPVHLDGTRVLTERARYLGLSRRGRVSCGGGTHLVRAGDGWVAVSLARPDDRDLLPAWLGGPPVDDGPAAWAEVHRRCAGRAVADVVARGVLLGLPVAALPGPGTPAPSRPAVVRGPHGIARPGSPRGARTIRVADLSSLWAGPLCARVLLEAGADVVKVESRARPDGARRGHRPFFDALNGDKRHRSVDLTSRSGVAELVDLLRAVDVVVESSRPRALEQLGVSAAELVGGPDGPAVWVSITGHGRQGEDALRVAFGDDAAVAGGLVAGGADGPWFCGDAVADPLTGLVAAAAALGTLAEGDGGLLDVSMAAVAASFAGSSTIDR